MSIPSALANYSMRRPRVVLWLVAIVVVVSSAGFIRLQVDTDPENMLPADDPVRVRNAMLREELGAGPMIVVGLFGDVATIEGLNAIDRLHDRLGEHPDVVAETSVSVGSVIGVPLQTQDHAEVVVDRVAADQLLAGNVLFADGSGAALFVGLVAKGAATDVAGAAEDLIAADPTLARYEIAIAGQPLAEDAFGQQMFVQMAVFAPLAGLLVFVIMLVFFRRLLLVVPAMMLAMATVIVTMGLLVGSGNTLHIMSSMIPIFLMPIAILDSVHVLSEFFDRYDGTRRQATISGVLDDLGRPIAYTTLTTAVGFGALVLVPIPPVRLFGLFVAVGVVLAWLLTMTLLPAFLVSVGEGRIVRAETVGRRSSVLPRLGEIVVNRRFVVLALFVLLGVGAAPALTSITVNDNPVRWFRSDHEVRQATDRLGDALPGTFTTSLLATETAPGALDDPETRAGIDALVAALRTQPEVGAIQAYTDGDHPILRTDELANLRLQLRTGDNTAMQEVVDAAEVHLAANPIPGVELEWAGEAYLNLTWQQKMVSGMLTGFATTLVVISLLLIALFRSLRWALIAIAPVIWTVAVVYGVLALVGRDFDMPVAVLSTMVLGIGVDFAIHFVERFRELHETLGSTSAAIAEFYREPATAMTRNAAVIAIGFSPLVLSSLVPYVVVGVLLASIVTLSWLASIVVLPAMISSPERAPEQVPVAAGA